MAMHGKENAGSTNLYHDNLRAPEPYAPREGNHDVEVAIIGGGLTAPATFSAFADCERKPGAIT